MLVAAPDQRGTGIGRELVAFAERRSRARGLRTMQLELLVPRDVGASQQGVLEAWYGRLGYRRVRTTRPEQAYPQLAPLLATPCELAVYEKPLRDGMLGSPCWSATWSGRTPRAPSTRIPG